MYRFRIFTVVTWISISAGCACGGEPKCKFLTNPIDHSWPNGHVRAGCPQNISCLAATTPNPHDCGYYVGGGARGKQGGPRYRNEGTWGWDFWGTLERKHVALNWYHGEKYQGGSGAYKTDGPKIFHHH